MNAAFWRGKRVFVTGHTGFKGAWLVQLLDWMGAEVTGYALSPGGSPNLFESADLLGTVRHVDGDVRDLARLTGAIADARPEVVLHLAAQALVRTSYQKPVETYATNVLGTVHLLEAVRGCPDVRVVVNITSDKCYENRDWEWGYRENDPFGGHDPYSNSKGCAELVTAAYRASFFRTNGQLHPAAVASARAGNVIGGGDWAADRLVPDCMRALSRGETISIRSPNATRPWQHVLEPLRGYLMLAEALWERPDELAGGWNFGPRAEDARPVRDVVCRLVERWGGEAAWQVAPDASLHEATSLQLDCSKARQRLHWEPKLNLNIALQWTVDWYRRFYEGEDARSLCQQQIKTFTTIQGLAGRHVDQVRRRATSSSHDRIANPTAASPLPALRKVA